MDFSQRRRVESHTGMNAGQRRDAAVSGTSAANLRKPRHAGIFQAVQKLDTELDQAARAELARWVRSEYESVLGDFPLGFVARCYLGPPYVDHILDLFHSIQQHFAPGDPMPDPFSQARMLVRTGAYAFVEIYASGTIIPVMSDGSAVA
jgi:hypothetical protein